VVAVVIYPDVERIPHRAHPCHFDLP